MAIITSAAVEPLSISGHVSPRDFLFLFSACLLDSLKSATTSEGNGLGNKTTNYFVQVSLQNSQLHLLKFT